MTAMLRTEGLFVNRKRVRRLMRLMGIEALGSKPRTTKPAPGHKIYPYLPRNVTIERANHVWAADISVPQQAVMLKSPIPCEKPRHDQDRS
jgi:putative transposase